MNDTYNTKNYTEQGGEKTVIGGSLVVEGTLEVADGAAVSGFPVADNQPDSTATTVADVKNDLNALLAKLKAAGIMKADE